MSASPQVTYPGVYIQEVPSPVRTITGVATSITAFVGYTPEGPTDSPGQVLNWGDYVRQFGGLNANSPVSYAVQQFFLNGGNNAWIVRLVDQNASAASVDLLIATDPGSAVAMTVTANSEGDWGNRLRIVIDYETADPDHLFNLTVLEIAEGGDESRVSQTEVHRNLSMDPASSSFAPNIVNQQSQLVKVKIAASQITRPVSNGTLGKPIQAWTPDNRKSMNLTIFTGLGVSEGPFQIENLWKTPPNTLPNLLSMIPEALAQALVNTAIKVNMSATAKQALSSATVTLQNDRLRIVPGGNNPNVYLEFANVAADDTAQELGLAAGGGITENLARYTLGTGQTFRAQANAHQGSAQPPASVDYTTGSKADRKGIFRLEDVDLFNILCIPDVTDTTVLAVARSYVADRRAFLLMDFPKEINTMAGARQWMNSNANLRHENAAIYFPRVQLADPLQANQVHPFPTGGMIAGLYARTDASRGVWKAPAGIDAQLNGVQSLDYTLTDQENGVLNPLGINCLRSFPEYGFVSWGARTLRGNDAMASEWKYIPVRRLALNIEESLFRGTKWVVFEPNDEPLWAQIRLNAGAFMHTLFRQGAFQGASPNDAYFVKCDHETTTQDDINHGIVNILVGFAPLKPAEFVVIKISQIAGQIQT